MLTIMRSLLSSYSKSLYEMIPKYDGKDDIQWTLDFTDKVKDYLDTIDISLITVLCIIMAKLIGNASLLWQYHKVNYGKESPDHIKDWRWLCKILFWNKITKQHEAFAISQLESL